MDSWDRSVNGCGPPNNSMQRTALCAAVSEAEGSAGGRGCRPQAARFSSTESGHRRRCIGILGGRPEGISGNKAPRLHGACFAQRSRQASKETARPCQSAVARDVQRTDRERGSQIESTFATNRRRSNLTNGHGARDATLEMMFVLAA